MNAIYSGHKEHHLLHICLYCYNVGLQLLNMSFIMHLSQGRLLSSHRAIYKKINTNKDHKHILICNVDIHTDLIQTSIGLVDIGVR